jgi:hypothetical protein
MRGSVAFPPGIDLTAPGTAALYDHTPERIKEVVGIPT